MQIESILKELGLNKNKGIVYMAALVVGYGTAQDIAKKARLPRTTVHEILQQLVSMGLVGFINKGERKRFYNVEPPAKLRTLLKEKERLLETALPALFSLMNKKGMRPQFLFFEGSEGIKTVFEDTLTVHNKLLLGILSMEDLYHVPGKDYMDEYVKRRVETGIHLRVIRSERKEVEETWPTSVKEHRELHYAPTETIFPMTVYIYDNKVGIIGTEKETFGMIIESNEFSQTLRNLFETMWLATKRTPVLE